VQFSQPIFMGSESSLNVTVALVLGGGTSSSDITVTVIPLSAASKKSCFFMAVTILYADTNILGDEVDYTTTPLPATFFVGTNKTEISIPINEDHIIETDEEINLIFTIPLSISNLIIAGTEMIATGVIIDSTGE